MSVHYLRHGRPRDSRRLKLAIAISVGIHLVMVAMLGFHSIGGVERKFYAPIHMVELAAPAPAPAPVPAPAVRAVPKAKAVAPKPEPKTAPPPKPVVEPAPKAKPAAKTIPKKIEDPPPKPERTYEEIRKKLEEMRRKSAEREAIDPAPQHDVQSSIDRIREKYGKTQAAPTTRQPSTGTAPTTATGVPSGLKGRIQEMRFSQYKNQLWAHVRRNWIVPPSLKGKGLEATVMVEMNRDGEVQDTWIENGSGNNSFDQSALKSVIRASPLPPVPSDIPDKAIKQAFGFHFKE